MKIPFGLSGFADENIAVLVVSVNAYKSASVGDFMADLSLSICNYCLFVISFFNVTSRLKNWFSITARIAVVGRGSVKNV